MNRAPERIQVSLPMEAIAAFCRRWHVGELALFGSVLEQGFGPDSDVDVLVTFAPATRRAPDREAIQTELEAIFGRPVDLVYRRVIEQDPNYILRRAILESAQVIYAAPG